MPDLVVRATLRDHVLPQLARMAAGMQALEKQMEASSKRTNATIERNSKKTQDEIFKIDNAMRGTARRMASRILLIGGVIAAAAGHAVALTAALWPMIGALGAIPAITVGGIAGIAALVMGFSGLGKAMKKTGGGAGSSASQITSAQRRIEMANRSLRDSQEALNDAWEEARDQLRDIQTQYAGAQLDVEGAALAVRDAELALREARSSGDRQERARADLALRQARLNQIEVANRLSDVEQEYNERLAKGVEGSDEVRDAQERQADAVYELAEAQKALNEALKGGGGGGGEDAYSKLSRSARKLVDTLRALGPEWRKVQQATQEALFAGVAEHVQALSDKFLPVMMRQLPGLAQGWNNMFTAIAGVAEQDNRVRDIDESLGLMGEMWRKVGTSFGKFFDGFLDWVRVGSDFLPRLGNWVDQHAEKWRRWSAEVRTTGEAAGWIENALVTGHKFNELIKSWSRSLFEVFRLGQDKTLLDRLIAGSQAFERWLKTAEGQERITNMWERMRDIGSAAWRVIKQALDILSQVDFSPLATLLGALAGALKVVADHMNLVNAALAPVLTAMLATKVATKGLAVGMALLRHPVLLAIGSLAVLNEALDKKVNPNIEALESNIKRYAQTGRQGEELTRLFGKDMSGLGEALKLVGEESPGFVKFFEDLGVIQKIGFDDAAEKVQGLDQAMSQLVSGGHANAAADMFDEITAAAKAQNVPVEKLKELFPEYFAALEAGEGTQRDATDAIEASVDAWRDAAGALDTYMDKLQQQSDPIFRYIRSQEQVAEAQAEVNRLVDEGKEGTPEYEQALLDLTEATLGMKGAAADAAAVDQTVLVPALQDLVDQGVLTQQQVDQITGSLQGAQAQAQAMDGLRSRIYLDVIANTVELQKALSGYYAQYGQYLANISRRAAGGPVTAGQPYVVGENGPELFVPGQSGSIVPNRSSGHGGGADVRVWFDIPPGSDYDLDRALVHRLRKFIRASGGSVQAALGRG